MAHQIAKRADCAQGLYLTPSLGSKIDSLQPLSISWDPTCLLQPPSSSSTSAGKPHTPDVPSNPSNLELDIYLYSPRSDFPRIHVWEKVFNSRGTFQADLFPRWWNATAVQTLQIIITTTGQPPFLARYPNGPVFEATYQAPASGTPDSADLTKFGASVTPINDLASQQTKKSIPGKTAAGVLVPLLLLAIGAFLFIRWKRTKRQSKSKKWTEKVDQRMSTISADWKSVSAAGANAAIRHSMALGAGSRTSSFSFGGGMRPSSAYALDDPSGADPTDGSAKKTGVGLRHHPSASTPVVRTSERVSRVSFAPDNHPRHSQSQSMYSSGNASRTSLAEGGRTSLDSNKRGRSFHTGHVPPVPALPALPDSVASPTSAMPLSGGHSLHKKSKSSLSHYPEDSDGEDNDNDGHSDDEHDNETTSNPDSSSRAFSPRQTAGALTLTPEDIRARIKAGQQRARSESQSQSGRGTPGSTNGSGMGMDDVLPALSLMRTGTLDPSQPDEYLLRSQASTPNPPEPAHPKALSSHTSSLSASAPFAATSAAAARAATASPVMPSMPMQTPVAASVMSPDEMLKAYADRKKALAAAAAGGNTSSIVSSTSSFTSGTPVISNPVLTHSTAMGSLGGIGPQRTGTPVTPVASIHSTGMRVAYHSEVTPANGVVSTPTGGSGRKGSVSVASHSTGGSSGGKKNNPFASSSEKEDKKTHQTTTSIGVGKFGGAKYAIGDEDDEEADVSAAATQNTGGMNQADNIVGAYPYTTGGTGAEGEANYDYAQYGQYAQGQYAGYDAQGQYDQGQYDQTQYAQGGYEGQYAGYDQTGQGYDYAAYGQYAQGYEGYEQQQGQGGQQQHQGGQAS